MALARCCLMALAFMVIGLPSAIAQESRFALVIGNKDYPAQPGKLVKPHSDANAVAAALRAVGFTVTLETDRSQSQIMDDVDKFREKLSKAGPTSIGFFYYSGHGASAENNGQRRNYLMPAKQTIANGAQLALRGVPVDQLLDGLSAANARAVFFVSDACRNTLPWSDAKGGEQSKAFVDVQRRSGLYIAFAAADGQTTPDDGYFATQLASHISKPGQTADRAFTLVMREVSKRRPGQKLPFVADGLTSDICFAACLPDPETDLWNFSRSLGTPDAIRAFLVRYPNGKFVEDARLALNPPTAPARAAVDKGAVSRTYIATEETAAAFMALRPGDSIDLAKLAIAPDARATPPATRVPVTKADLKALPDFALFRECELCPQMVMLPEAVRDTDGDGDTTDEKPFRIAVSRFEITWDNWESCSSVSACAVRGDSSWGRGNRPVINISWRDANDYARFIAEKTGATYRLPAAEEWDWFARAGSTGRYTWGSEEPVCDPKSPRGANFSYCRDNQTREAGTFGANPWGLFDTIGNASEWVNPTCRTSDWGSQHCLYKGGSWRTGPGDVYMTVMSTADDKADSVGMRLVRVVS